MVLGMCGITLALITWNKVFFVHLAENPGVRPLGVFRFARRSLHWPMYGKADVANAILAIPAVLFGAILAVHYFYLIVSERIFIRMLLFQLVAPPMLFIWRWCSVRIPFAPSALRRAAFRDGAIQLAP